MTSPSRRFALGIVFSSLFSLTASAAPSIEKSVRSRLMLAESDQDPISVILEGEDTSRLRDLLGAHAERDLPLIQAVAGRVPAGKLRDLLSDEGIRAVYADEPVQLIAPVEAEDARVEGEPDMPLLDDVLGEEEKRAGITYGLRLINAPPAVQFVRKWRKMVAEKLGQELPQVRIGIVDTGIDANHPQFKGTGVIYDWADLSFDFSPEARDDHGHGTHVAGTIAGGKSPEGITFGVIPQDMAKLAIGRGLNPGGTDSWLISALAWMADPDGDPATDDGVHVINNSWGSSRRGNLYARVIQALTDMGVLVVFAAGNSGPEPGTVGSPGHLPDVLTVGAVDHHKRVTSFSSRGDAIVNKSEIPVKPDVCAPGNSVYSIGPMNTFQRWPGTSMATPHVTAVAALVRMVNPNLKPKDVKLLLEETAQDLGRPGKDEQYGSGLVDALAAVRKAAELFGEGGMTPEDDPAALLAQAREYIKVRKTQYAVDNLFAVINRFPDLPLADRVEAGYLMGEAYRELGNFKGAIAAYQGVAMLDPTSPYVPKGEYWSAWCYINAKGDEFIPLVRRGIHMMKQFLNERADHDWMPLAGLELARGHIRLHQPGAAKQTLMLVLKMRPQSEHRLNIMTLLQSLEEAQDTQEF